MKKHTSRFLGIISLFLGSCVSLTGQDLAYSSGSTGADGAFSPAYLPNLAGPAHSYDVSRNKIVLFGGHVHFDAGNGEPARPRGRGSETWTFDGTTWVQEAPATAVPAREHASMVYDAVRNECVMFGGVVQNEDNLGDTWTWNGTNWTLKTSAVSPEPRHGAKMIWDTQNQRILLFGGYNRKAGKEYDDTWTWNGTEWKKLSLETKPLRPDGTAYNGNEYDDMIWDEQTNKAVLTNVRNRKTYTFDGTTWTDAPSLLHPDVGQWPQMVYDPVRQETVLGPGASRNETWVYKNNQWSMRTPATSPVGRYAYGFIWHNVLSKAVMINGYNGSMTANTVESWDGTNWQTLNGKYTVFDMSARPSGIWNFTSIFIPAGLEITFKKNAQNTPVTWLATQNVVINGTLFLDGKRMPSRFHDFSGTVAEGGPGGFDGGLGGTNFDVSGVYNGQAGQGPGGGRGGVSPSEYGTNAEFNGKYGNLELLPLIGGSGGGGGASSTTGRGGYGGGGGGAILIASSLDIVINGAIYARGGSNSYGDAGSYGGNGSGGAVKLVADRVNGDGGVNADPGGRVRVEAFFRKLVPRISPAPSYTAPINRPVLVDVPSLMIENVAGTALSQPPSGLLSSPDVVFSTSGSISVLIRASNLPAGTNVQLRMTTSTGVIVLPPANGEPVTLDAAGTALFNTTVPSGRGTLQAMAEIVVP